VWLFGLVDFYVKCPLAIRTRPLLPKLFGECPVA